MDHWPPVQSTPTRKRYVEHLDQDLDTRIESRSTTNWQGVLQSEDEAAPKATEGPSSS
jgi:hypothetical protein